MTPPRLKIRITRVDYKTKTLDMECVYDAEVIPGTTKLPIPSATAERIAAAAGLDLQPGGCTVGRIDEQGRFVLERAGRCEPGEFMNWLNLK